MPDRFTKIRIGSSGASSRKPLYKPRQDALEVVGPESKVAIVVVHPPERNVP